jgi:DNA-binding transcriptional LysR family regulator
VAALPDFIVSDSIKAGLLVPLLTDYSLQEGAVYVVRPPGRIAAAKTRAFVDAFVEYLGAAATNEQKTIGAKRK